MDALDALRGLAAIWVLGRHVWMFAGKPEGLWGEVWRAGDLGVPLFFVLSGLLLWQPWAAAARGEAPAPRLWAYAMRRAGRVLPGYWLALAGAVIILAGTGHPQQMPGVQWLPAYLLFAHNYIPAVSGSVDPPMWTLLIEVSFYALVPLVGMLAVQHFRTGRRQMLLLGALAAMGLAYSAAYVAWGWPAEAGRALPMFLAVFAVGMGCAALVKQLRGRAAVRAAAMVCGCAAVAVYAMTFRGVADVPVMRVLGDLPAAAGFSLLVAGCAAGGARWLAVRPLRWLGDVSYAVYLWHFPVIYLLTTRGWWPQDFTVALVLTAAVTVPASALSWHLVERPVLRRVQRMTAR